MRLCDGCERHVKALEPVCPFCHARLGATEPPRPTAGFVLTAALLLAGCADRAGGGDGTGPDGTTGVGSTSTTSATSTSGSTTTSGTTSSTTGTGDGSSETGSTSEAGCDPPPGTSGGGFYAAAPDVTNWDCDVYQQDCEDGLKCAPVSDAGTKLSLHGLTTECVPLAADAREVGQPCTAEDHPFSGRDDCVAGAWCWGADADTLEGTCVGLCQGCQTDPDPSCTPVGTTCVRTLSWTPLCLSECDPLGDPCPTGQSCRYDGGVLDGRFLCVADYADPAAGQHGDPCEDDTDCHAGVCALDGGGCTGQSCCADYCEVGVPDACPGSAQGELCDPLAGSVGACVSP